MQEQNENINEEKYFKKNKNKILEMKNDQIEKFTTGVKKHT